MQELINRTAYAPDVALEIESRGELAVSIANRWMLVWPGRVKTMLEAGVYLDCLASQTEEEKDILAKQADLQHLARHEILQMYEIKESPPVLEG